MGWEHAGSRVNVRNFQNTLFKYLAIKARIMGSFASLQQTKTLPGDAQSVGFVVESQTSSVFCNGPASGVSLFWFIGTGIGIGIAVLASSQSHDIPMGITHHKGNSCFDVRAAMLSEIFHSALDHSTCF